MDGSGVAPCFPQACLLARTSLLAWLLLGGACLGDACTLVKVEAPERTLPTAAVFLLCSALQIHSLMIKKTSAVTTTVLGEVGASLLQRTCWGEAAATWILAARIYSRAQICSRAQDAAWHMVRPAARHTAARPSLPGSCQRGMPPAGAPTPSCLPACLPACPSLQVKIIGLLVLSAMLLGEGKEFTLKMTMGVVLAMAGFAMYSHSKIQRLRDVQPRCAGLQLFKGCAAFAGSLLACLGFLWVRMQVSVADAHSTRRLGPGCHAEFHVSSSQHSCVLTRAPSAPPRLRCCLSRVISLTASGNGSSPELVPLKVGDMSTMHRVASSNGSSVSQV